MIIVAVILALLVGVSLGLLGGGGSILTVPILRYVLGMEAHRAVALSLLVVGTTSLAALIPHARKGRVRWRTALIFGAAGMVGAFLAGRVAHLIPAVLLLVAFGVMMLVTAVAMLRGRSSVSAPAQRELPVAKVLGEGLVVGAVTGLVGAGGGFLVVPALVILGGLPMEVAVGTSLVVIAMKSFAGFAGFLGHTPIDWTLAAWVSGAAVVGSFAGGALADRISPARLRSAFGWFVVAMAFFILGQELPRAFGLVPSVALPVGLAVVGTALAAAGKQLFSRAKAASMLASGAAAAE
ncbi:MAG: sulfite exporter TauE/SafE family protein [Myxococcales bacterium]|nr:sulfite exporter TauE/SafE family protein [Myxococcales bacterium]